MLTIKAELEKLKIDPLIIEIAKAIEWGSLTLAVQDKKIVYIDVKQTFK